MHKKKPAARHGTEKLRKMEKKIPKAAKRKLAVGRPTGERQSAKQQHLDGSSFRSEQTMRTTLSCEGEIIPDVGGLSEIRGLSCNY